MIISAKPITSIICIFEILLLQADRKEGIKVNFFTVDIKQFSNTLMNNFSISF